MDSGPSSGDKVDAGEDQDRCEQKFAVDLLAQKQHRQQKTDDRLQVNINGHNRRADPRKCPRVQQVWRSGRTNSDVEDQSPNRWIDRMYVNDGH